MTRTLISSALRARLHPRNVFATVIFAAMAAVLLPACGDDPCKNISCSGHGTCATVANSPSCICDNDYHPEGLSCIVDEVNACGSRECGSDGRGHSCGSCTGVNTCNQAGQCVPPASYCGARVCGDDGYGHSCGSCPSATVCNSGGQCVPTTASLRVVNNTSTTLSYLYVVRDKTTGWGPDQLGAHIISPGGSFTLNGIPCPATYDLKVTDITMMLAATSDDVGFNCGYTNTWTIH